MNRIKIITGHFGSGKSEISINYAAALAKENTKTVVVDMDIVNTYFRSADAIDFLEKSNIKMIKPIYANTNVDVPALPAEIYAVLDDQSYTSILDLGGDDIGAAAAGRYRNEIIEAGYDMFFVINSFRPMTNTLEKVLGMMHSIEEKSGLKITHLINNTNLMQDTTSDQIIEGLDLIKRISNRTNIPIAFTSCRKEFANELNEMSPLLIMDKFIGITNE